MRKQALRKTNPDLGNRKCGGPKIGRCSSCLRSFMEAIASREVRTKEKVVGDGIWVWVDTT
jgi:hypothetical protein